MSVLTPNEEMDTSEDMFGNSVDKLRHRRSDAYSAAQVLLNKQ